MELQRHSSQQKVVEVLRGELRIGEELNKFQELLKEWYYTAFFVGTLSFAVFYLFAWSIFLRLLQRIGFFRIWHGLEEPECELDMDFSLGGGLSPDDNECGRRNDLQPEGTEEPRFEDWQDHFETPPPQPSDSQQERSAPIPDTAPSAQRSCYSRENSEDDWEDIFYSASEQVQRS